MKRVLVTGGTGFVGANLTRRLLRDGNEVHLLVRPKHQGWRIESVRADLRLPEAELHDAAAVSRVVQDVKPEWVFHLAANGAYSWQNNLDEIVRTNVHGTINLLTACLKQGVEAFVSAGSSSEYGFKDHPPAESEREEPNSHYAVTKVSATHFCRFTAQKDGLHAPTLRLYSIYGPYEDPGRLIPTLISRGLKGELPPLVDPNVARDLVYVDDAVDAFLLAATKKTEERGAIYNVGTGVETTIREIVDVARREMDIAVEPSWGSMPNRVWDTTSWVSDNRKIREKLGWKPRYTFTDGLKATINWYREVGQGTAGGKAS